MGTSHSRRFRSFMAGHVRKRVERVVKQRDHLSQLQTREPPAPVSGNAFVYILARSDGAVYVGSCGDFAKHLGEHGGLKSAKFTCDHPGGRLIHVEGPLSITLALQRERQFKRWSRAKKLPLFAIRRYSQKTSASLVR
jgi:putative endonuclease